MMANNIKRNVMYNAETKTHTKKKGREKKTITTNNSNNGFLILIYK
jgi:hypothetical protein